MVFENLGGWIWAGMKELETAACQVSALAGQVLEFFFDLLPHLEVGFSSVGAKLQIFWTPKLTPKSGSPRTPPGGWVGGSGPPPPASPRSPKKPLGGWGGGPGTPGGPGMDFGARRRNFFGKRPHTVRFFGGGSPPGSRAGLGGWGGGSPGVLKSSLFPISNPSCRATK